MRVGRRWLDNTWRLLQDLRESIGSSGLTGLLMAFFSVPLMIPLVAAHEEAGRLDSHVKTLTLHSLAPPSPVKQSSSQAITLPHVTDLPDAIDLIHQIAAAEGITLPTAQYKLLPKAADRQEHYEISLPLSADYRVIRRFLFTTFNALPTLALTELNLRQEDNRGEGLSATLRFAIYFEGASR